jgi:hypothetical protein
LIKRNPSCWKFSIWLGVNKEMLSIAIGFTFSVCANKRV